MHWAVKPYLNFKTRTTTDVNKASNTKMKIYINHSSILRAAPADERALSDIIDAQVIDLIEKKLDSFFSDLLYRNKKQSILEQIQQFKTFVGEDAIAHTLSNPTFTMRSAPVRITVVTGFGNKTQPEGNIEVHGSAPTRINDPNNQLTATLCIFLPKPSFLFNRLYKNPRSLTQVLYDAHDTGRHELSHARQTNLQPAYSQNYTLNNAALLEVDRLRKKYWIPLTRRKQGLKLLEYLTSPTEIEPQILSALIHFNNFVASPDTHTTQQILDLKKKYLGISQPKMSAEQVVRDLLSGGYSSEYDINGEKSPLFYGLKSLDPDIYNKAVHKFETAHSINIPLLTPNHPPLRYASNTQPLLLDHS